jgi:acetolactate synthase-1/2/3 large subunit
LGHVRSVRAKALLGEADLMIAIGARFTEVTTTFRTMPVPNKLIQIDLDSEQIGMNYPVLVGIVADASVALHTLLEHLPKHKSTWGEAWEKAKRLKPASTEWLIDVLRAELPDDAIVFTDACEMAFRMQGDFPAYGPRSFFYPSNYIALGWGFPAALGGAVAAPHRLVAAVCGDGGFTMSTQELATAARYKLRVIAIVHNDSSYGAIKNTQKNKHEGRFVDTDLNNPDFVALAQAYGVKGLRVRSANEFADALRQAIQHGGPFVIEVVDSWRYLRPS